MKNKDIITRIIDCADYYIDNKSTMRKTAKMFGISKSTVHVNLSRDLKYIDKDRYKKVKKISNDNKKKFNDNNKVKCIFCFKRK